MVKVIDLRGKTMGGQDKRSRITKIARHHSATDSGDVFTFERHWKNARGWRTGGYHEVILRDGTVQLCYDSNVVTNGVYGHNQTTYHICLVGNGNFTDEQEQAFDERVKVAMKRFGLSVDDVLGHREFSGQSTSCPGIDMNKVRSRLKGEKVIDPKQKIKPATTTKPTITKQSNGRTIVKTIQSTLNKRYGLNIAVDNIFGPETKKALVKGLQTELNRQFDARIVVDGIFGPKTKAACVNVRIGARGNITWIIQAALYCLGYDPKGLDCIFGRNTANAVLAFQKANGLAQDAIVGKNTFAKMFA